MRKDERTLTKNIRSLELMFQIFNEKFFQNKLEAAITISDERVYSLCSGMNRNLGNKVGSKILHTLVFPSDIVYTNSKPLVVRMLSQMIVLDAMECDVKITSGSSNSYRNKNFKRYCEKIGLEVKHGKYGWYPTENICENIMKLVRDLKFEHRPTFCAQKNIHITEAWKKPSGRRPSSTRKYIDEETGMSVRATKEHILFCLTNHPNADEIATKIEKEYGVKRMVKGQ